MGVSFWPKGIKNISERKVTQLRQSQTKNPVEKKKKHKNRFSKRQVDTKTEREEGDEGEG